MEMVAFCLIPVIIFGFLGMLADIDQYNDESRWYQNEEGEWEFDDAMYH